MREYDEFITYCNRSLCLRNTIFNKKTCARETKRKACYKKYTVKQGKSKKRKVDERWERVKAEVFERDEHNCRIQSLLGHYSSLPVDPAHVIRRSQSKKLYYDKRNIVSLSRLYHTRLDSYLDPLTGKSITREEADSWWKKIVGQETWDYLQENK